MKLFNSASSPYVRKVRVLALETGIHDQLELVDAALTPINPSADVVSNNPLGKIPALVLDDGTALFDSRVICEYLDSLHSGARMFPESGSARWRAITLQALSDGMLDAAIIARYETFLRPEELRWPEWTQAQTSKFRRGTDQLEKDAGSLGTEVNIGTISVGCALGYLDFRYPDENWRDGHPTLAGWFEAFASRDSMQATRPPQ